MNGSRIMVVSLVVLFLGLSGSGYAGMHGGKKEEAHSESMKGHTGKEQMMEGAHGKGMSGHGSMGEEIFSGHAFGTNLKGSMVDVKAKMEKMGMSAHAGITHHFMLTPENPLAEGTAAKVMVTYPGGKTTEVLLTSMENHIGADLNLDEKGAYRIECVVFRGSEKQSFPFDYEVK